MAVNKHIVETSTIPYYKGWGDVEGYGCKNCGEKESELILEKTIYDIRDRGNENDRVEWWCRKCSADDKTWEKYEQELEEEQRRESKELEELKKTIIKKVTTASTFIELLDYINELADEYSL